MFQRYCRFCAPACHFSHPTSSLPKIFHVSLGVGGWPLGYTKTEDVGLRAIGFQDLQLMYVVLIHQRYRRTDRHTDDMQSQYRAKVHRAIKTTRRGTILSSDPTSSDEGDTPSPHPTYTTPFMAPATHCLLFSVIPILSLPHPQTRPTTVMQPIIVHSSVRSTPWAIKKVPLLFL